jgi:CDP-4-dehydro-6-deoxyglucose reductase
MARLVSVARAARIIGVDRKNLQGQIRRGELPTFEGQIDIDLIQDLYPTTRFEDSGALERTRHIKETAFGRRVMSRILPDSNEDLANKNHNLQKDLAIERLKARRYEDLVHALGRELNKLQENATREQSMTIACLKGWLLVQLKKI